MTQFLFFYFQVTISFTKNIIFIITYNFTIFLITKMIFFCMCE